MRRDSLHRNTSPCGSSLEDDDDKMGDWAIVMRKHRRVENVDPSGGEESSCMELARAFLKLGEVYVRIEGAMMNKLEKQRMEAAKKLELRRMNMLMDMQMEHERSKLGKRELLHQVRSCMDSIMEKLLW
ncbi:unnamed protein product [Eruca vesicaria subsp. sativa]|uniref:Uncharacterized protein n=1 Tax=Eruca vesicaria subsp. sativa TaxID=29727 RepID=A0ABC8IYC8_ERUVS|nr:unnamed protein product [Eruca vesicaria subsp. sativa]